MRLGLNKTREDGKMEIKRFCYECKLGEHDNYDDDVKRCRVFESDTGDLKYVCVYLCCEHRQALIDDGYEVVILN
jgi:hypothetical protein